LTPQALRELFTLQSPVIRSVFFDLTRMQLHLAARSPRVGTCERTVFIGNSARLSQSGCHWTHKSLTFRNRVGCVAAQPFDIRTRTFEVPLEQYLILAIRNMYSINRQRMCPAYSALDSHRVTSCACILLEDVPMFSAADVRFILADISTITVRHHLCQMQLVADASVQATTIAALAGETVVHSALLDGAHLRS
jgi:hypothetical protein